MRRTTHHGFTLVELAIVLVIIGLIVGGVLVGKELIHITELRTITVEANKLDTAINTFRLKYRGLPGDITNATDYWPVDPNGCPLNAVQTRRTGTCNGDGDGMIGGGNYGYDASMAESFRAMQQLGNALLISGQFTGVTGLKGTASSDTIPGLNIPASKTNPSVGWSYTYWVYNPWSKFVTDGNYLMVGMEADGNGMNDGPFLSTMDAKDIDEKIDDGMPGSGRVTGFQYYECTDSDDAQAAVYDLTNTGTHQCGLMFFQH